MNYMAEYLLKKQRIQKEDTTPNDELRALVEEWKGKEQHPNATELEQVIWGTAIIQLEELIDDE